jgi:hypothetical protein
MVTPDPGAALTIRAMLRPIRPNPLMPSATLTQTPQADLEQRCDDAVTRRCDNATADGRRKNINPPSRNRH